MNFESYKDRKILITGHTGFKGSWLSLWLEMLGAKLVGYALDPKTERDNYILSGLSKSMVDYRHDIRDKEKLFKVMMVEQPEIIFHLAAQPLVLESYQKPLETFDANIMGTANILEAFRLSANAKILIVVTTDKVYENKEQILRYREDDRIGGKDPYSASKSAVEMVVNSYHESFFNNASEKLVVTARAGNVIGGGDWSENRIIPDCIRAIEKNKVIQIRNPLAIRPWQHVLEPLGGYLLLGEQLLNGQIKGGGGWNFGPCNDNEVTVEKLVKKFIEYYGSGSYTIQKKSKKIREANYLGLDISKAIHGLGWHPMLSFDETIALTAEWYKNESKSDIRTICLNQIERYMKLWNLKNEK